MDFQLKSLRLADGNAVAAEFRVAGEPLPVTTVFDVHDGEIPTASADPDVFVHFRGTAEEVRRIVAAVLAFARACS